MQKRAGRLIFSPSDINRYSESPFASWMDRFHLEHQGALKPDERRADIALIAEKGIAHEKRHLDRLEAIHGKLWEPPSGEDRFEATVTAMRQGRDVIYQAALQHGEFEGYADFLHRVETPSLLGPFSYEISDTKLARKTKPYFLLQLCSYAKMLEHIQGVRPEKLHIVNGDGEQLSYRTDDYFFYFTSLEREFLEAQQRFNPDLHPIPDARADHGRWGSHAEEILGALDHPARTAGITKHQMKRLAEAGIATMTALAAHDGGRVPRMDTAVVHRLAAQARLQRASAGCPVPAHEVLAPNAAAPRSGLALLPPSSPGDVYFDMEGYPLVEGGLEYLFGATHIEKGAIAFTDFWGHDRTGEKRAFEQFVDWVFARFRRDPSMHIFHYAPYEVTALRRLMGTHGTREKEVDALLKAQVFVDLYRVVKQSVRIGEESYSLKNVERLYRSARAGDVGTAGESMVEYARWLEEKDGDTWQTSRILGGIRAYNRDDCESTLGLRRWLAVRQMETKTSYLPPVTKTGADGEENATTGERPDEILAARLLAQIPADPSADPERWRVHELIAQLVGFHRREAKPIHWAMFDRQAKPDEELVEDIDCLGALVRTRKPPVADKQSFIYEYKFDTAQDTKLQKGSNCFIAESLTRVQIEKLDLDLGIVAIRQSNQKETLPATLSLIPDELVKADKIAESIARIAVEWVRTGALPTALDTLLRKKAPRVRGRRSGERLVGKEETTETAVTELIAGMNSTTLAVQGPPGAGKTRVASAAIAALVMSGKRVGISSNSHKAIQKLIEGVLRQAKLKRVAFRVTKINPSGDDELVATGQVTAGTMNKIDFAAHDAPQVVGGTAWAFSDLCAAEKFDYLFVDEAGQVSLANLVGMSPSAKNLVLLGDQMQLGQPTQGAHPGESGRSALDYLLQGHRTIPDHLGVFLAKTWRLHPDLCRLVSGAIYEGRLEPEQSTSARVVRLGAGAALAWKEAGVVFVSVEHEGNAQSSDEEVDAIRALLTELRGRKLTGADGSGKKSRALGDADILVVAPYNMQVRKLQAALGPVRVGSVDKFQGQEAPVVIVSMCASSGEAFPRGLEFLFNANRLNVALSRAQSLAIVVGSPDLARTRVRSVEQMKLVNLYCRIVEEGGRE